MKLYNLKHILFHTKLPVLYKNNLSTLHSVLASHCGGLCMEHSGHPVLSLACVQAVVAGLLLSSNQALCSGLPQLHSAHRNEQSYQVP